MSRVKQLEEKTVRRMIEIYCNNTHKTKGKQLCPACERLFAYSKERIQNCPHGNNKPVCAKCKVHCYSKDMREKIRQVMRYAGPRMLYASPVLTLRYMLRKLFI